MTAIAEKNGSALLEVKLLDVARGDYEDGHTLAEVMETVLLHNRNYGHPPLAESRVRQLARAPFAKQGHSQPVPEAKPAKPTAPAVETFTAAELETMEVPEERWAVPGILPAGMSILAAKPKIGKSWLALQIAVAIAGGGSVLGAEVETGSVLYLALEDTKRRLQKRMRKLCPGGGWPSKLTLARQWPRQGKGGLEAIDEWLTVHPDAKLVIIDTWAKFRPAKTRGKDSYEEDYEHASAVKALADKHGVNILPIHHNRKMAGDDEMDNISGTLGLPGCCDCVLILKRERGQHDAALFLSGRDVEERELALKWDAAYCLWSLMGTADEYRLSKERAEIMDVLRKQGTPMTPKAIADLIGKTPNNTRQLCWHMANGGWLVSKDGEYSIPENKKEA